MAVREVHNGIVSVEVTNDLGTCACADRNSFSSKFLIVLSTPEIPNSGDHILAVLAAAAKHDMVTIRSSIRTEIVRRKLTCAGVFRVYAVAYRKAFSGNGDGSPPKSGPPGNLQGFGQ